MTLVLITYFNYYITFYQVFLQILKQTEPLIIGLVIKCQNSS